MTLLDRIARVLAIVWILAFCAFALWAAATGRMVM